MDTDVETPTEQTNHNQTTLDLPAIIKELKNDIATIVHEMRTLFQQQLTPMLPTTSPPTSVT